MFIGILCIESGCTQGISDEVLELSTAGFTAFRHLVFHFSLAIVAKWGPLHFSPGLELRMNQLLSGPQLRNASPKRNRAMRARGGTALLPGQGRATIG